ncbi:Short-chain dehydrogenase/reductase prx1, partial [Fulvia fulva]|uniref:Short-chain dehydrogenase/reductase prx1 n=1 Tax=Passalora fulva TaxID=5499 RepID=A0A9Q8LAK6_PASFU
MALTQPYAQDHTNLQGPGDSRPTAKQVIEDQGLVDILPGTVVLITGCTSGIGIETARALYLTGATIYITARSLEKGQEVALDLATDPQRPVKVLEMSLDSFASIRAAAQTFLEQESKLNILICNAGVMACPQTTTKDGFEYQFGTNHLGHFLLFQLLKHALLAGATPSHPSRVISVSSTGHRIVPSLPLTDLDFSKSQYHPFTAYGRSKLANIYFANHLTRLYATKHLHALSLHPGSIKTPLQRHVDQTDFYAKATSDPEYQRQVKSVEQGAATTVWAAVGKEWMHRGGVYLEDVGEAGPVVPGGTAFGTGYGEAAYRPEDERKLWGGG